MSEGWHSFFKGSDVVREKTKSRRLDWLINTLQVSVITYYEAGDTQRCLGAISSWSACCQTSAIAPASCTTAE